VPSVDCMRNCLLIREAQGGNQAAFEQLVHIYDPTVLRLARRLTGSASDAQDIHQEAFLKVYKKLGGFRFDLKTLGAATKRVPGLCSLDLDPPGRQRC
jgi:RNA polymerase sigma-70 factor, ECF subfamily